MKSHVRVCIVGGGAMGVGVLYHLAEQGWGDDIMLLEKGELTSGSTWHAAGQCPHFTGSLSLSKIHHYGTELYPKLEAMTGQAVSWHGCGGLRLALTPEEVDWFEHVRGLSRLTGYECDVIGPGEIAQYHPYLETKDVLAAFLSFTDGHVAPADTTNAMAQGARHNGATIHRRVLVTDINHLASGEWEVVTDKGTVIAEHVVNAAGSYAETVGKWTGHNVPHKNMLHHYLISEPVRQLVDRDVELPVVRDPYSKCYIREEGKGVLIGPYESSTAHLCFDERPSWDFENELLPDEVDRLLPWLELATERMPLFGEAGLKSIIAGAITHTPDGNFLLGKAPGAPNYWMATGAAIGIAQGAGAGKYLAQVMAHGDADIDMREFDPRRFGEWADNDYVSKLAICDYEAMYDCMPPGRHHDAGRPKRTSALHDRVAEMGAQFAPVFAMERPRWYADSTAQDHEHYSFRRGNWNDAVRAECMAVREAVGIADLSAFAKFEVKGTDAYAMLDRLCANRLPRVIGGTVLTHALSPNGRVVAEFTITRLADDHFYLLSGAAAQAHDVDLLRNGVQPGQDAVVTDVTDERGAIAIAGPRARDLLAAVTGDDVGNDALRWLRATNLTVAGQADVRTLRVSYVGELGYELHSSRDSLPSIFDALLAAATPMGGRLFGAYAMNALRMEKAYSGFGTEMTGELNMVENSLERFIALTRKVGDEVVQRDFVGRAATEKAMAEPQQTKVVMLQMDEADDADAHGGEPVYAGNDVVGVTTSGAYGYAVEASLLFACVPPSMATEGTAFDVLLLGKRRGAKVLGDVPYDPDSERLRG